MVFGARLTFGAVPRFCLRTSVAFFAAVPAEAEGRPRPEEPRRDDGKSVAVSEAKQSRYLYYIGSFGRLQYPGADPPATRL